MWRKMKKGFTLIELMVVISIIVILVAMLYPSVDSAIKTSYASAVQTRVTELNNGCILFRGDNNYYPGQSAANATELANAATTGATGSQVLAEAMFLDFTDTNWDNNNGAADHSPTADRLLWHWKSVYASLGYGISPGTTKTTSRSDLMNNCGLDPGVSAGAALNSAAKPYCISDRFKNGPLPILYYPAHLTDPTNGTLLTGLGQFLEADNIDYYNFTDSKARTLIYSAWYTTVPGGALTTDFNNFITDFRFCNTPGTSTTPYHAGEFLLIAAGRDRMYGSRYTIKNWSN